MMELIGITMQAGYSSPVGFRTFGHIVQLSKLASKPMLSHTESARWARHACSYLPRPRDGRFAHTCVQKPWLMFLQLHVGATACKWVDAKACRPIADSGAFVLLLRHPSKFVVGWRLLDALLWMVEVACVFAVA